jgi:hypothetical protein
MGFHSHLARHLPTHLRAYPGMLKKFQILLALGIWHVANAWGFAVESMFGKRR